MNLKIETRDCPWAPLLQEHVLFLRDLRQDVEIFRRAYNHNSGYSQSYGRTVVVSAARLLEGCCASVLRDWCVLGADQGILEIDVADRSALERTQYEVKKGRGKRKVLKAATLDRIRLPIQVLQDYVDMGFDAGSHQWEDAQQVIATRDRVTHPRNGNDLRVSDYEVRKACEVSTWALGLVVETWSSLAPLVDAEHLVIGNADIQAEKAHAP